MPAKIALIGAGVYGPVLFQALQQSQKRGKCDVVAFAARTPETVAKREEEFGVKGWTDWERMLRDEPIDAVVVATPDHLHRDMAIRAAEMGKHVLVEKPMEVTAAGAEAMLAAARSNNTLLQVDMHKRFDPYHRRCRDLVRSGKLGEVQYGFAWIEEKITMPRDEMVAWAANTTPGWLVGTHMLDVLLWITGLKPVRVYATGQKGKLTSLGIDTYDSIQLFVELANGGNLTIHTSWVHPEGFEAPINQGLRLVGSEGVIEIDSQDRGARSCLADEGMATYNTGFWAEREGADGQPIFSGYAIESVESFVDNVDYLLGGGSLADLAGRYPSGEEGLEVTCVLAAAHQALADGRVQTVEGIPA